MSLQTLFRYNWMVREEWYRWCEDVNEEELLRNRTGGVGSILHTLFHIIDVEWSWILVCREICIQLGQQHGKQPILRYPS